MKSTEINNAQAQTQICSPAKFAWLLTHHNLQIIGGAMVLVFAVTNWIYAATWVDVPTMSSNRHLGMTVLSISILNRLILK